MIITTNSRLWIHDTLLPLAHSTNELIESDAGDWADLLSVMWDTEESDGKHTLRLRIVDSTGQHNTLTVTGIADRSGQKSALDKFREWRSSKATSHN